MTKLNSNKLEIYIFSLGIISLLITLIIGKTNLLFTFIALLIIVVSEYLFSFRKNIFSFPYIFFIFIPVTMIHYSSIKDFQIRLFTYIFFTYIISFAIYKPVKSNIHTSKLSNLSPLKIWGIAFLIFSITSILIFNKGVYLSGDEPDFLIITQSIIEDFDFELTNNYTDESYFKLKPELKGTNWNITPHITMHNNKTRSFHMPGVSFLMVPFYAIYKLMGSPIHPAIYFRFAIAFYNAFFALSIFFLLKLYFKNKNIFTFWIIIITTFPILFHSITLFPEIPAALLSINFFIFGFTKYKNYFIAGLFLSMIPWFHVKYYPLVIVFTIGILIQLFKKWRIDKKHKDLFLFIILPFISLVLLMIYCKLLYGTINPTQIFPKQNYFLNPLLKVKVFFAYFIDQRDGLISYAPYLIFLFLGLKNKFKNKSILIISASSYVLLHAFTTIRGAYAPAGRPLIFVLWILILFLANYYFINIDKNKEKLGNFFYKLSIGTTYFFTVWMFYYPFFMFQPVFSGTKNRASDLLNYLGSDTINLPSFFPSFLSKPVHIHYPNFIWIFVLTIIIIIFYIKKKSFKPLLINIDKLKTILAILFFIFSVILLSYYPHIHFQKKNLFIIDKIPIYKTAKLFHYLDETKGKYPSRSFRLKEGFSYNLYINLNSWRNKKKTLLFSFKKHINTDISIFTKNQLIDEKKNKKEMNFKIKLSSLKIIKIKNKYYGHLSIITKTKTKNSHLYLNISSYK